MIVVMNSFVIIVIVFFLQGFHFIVSICILCQIIVFCQSKLSYKVVVQYI